MIMQVSKFCIDLFSRVVRVYLFSFFCVILFFSQFSSIFGLLAKSLSVTLKISLVHWSGPLHRLSSPKIASVLKPFRSQDLPVTHQGPFKLPHFVSSRCYVRSKKYGDQDHSRPLKNFIGSVSEPLHSFQNMFLGVRGPFETSNIFGLRALSNLT